LVGISISSSPFFKIRCKTIQQSYLFYAGMIIASNLAFCQYEPSAF
jgi:hypothetical protein